MPTMLTRLMMRPVLVVALVVLFHDFDDSVDAGCCCGCCHCCPCCSCAPCCNPPLVIKLPRTCPCCCCCRPCCCCGCCGGGGGRRRRRRAALFPLTTLPVADAIASPPSFAASSCNGDCASSSVCAGGCGASSRDGCASAVGGNAGCAAGCTATTTTTRQRRSASAKAEAEKSPTKDLIPRHVKELLPSQQTAAEAAEPTAAAGGGTVALKNLIPQNPQLLQAILSPSPPLLASNDIRQSAPFPFVSPLPQLPPLSPACGISSPEYGSKCSCKC